MLGFLIFFLNGGKILITFFLFPDTLKVGRVLIDINLTILYGTFIQQG